MIQQGFEDLSLNRAQVFQWHARFNTGRTSVDDMANAQGDPQVAQLLKLARIEELIHQDRRWTICEEMEVGYGTFQRVLTEGLGMHRVTAKFVPRILTADQKQQCGDVCTELHQLASDNGCYPPTQHTPLIWHFVISF
jgi:hypothetical protein